MIFMYRHVVLLYRISINKYRKHKHMSSTLFPHLTDKMPPWHYQQTFHLTEAAVQNPLLLLEEFFDCYSLPDIRHCLREWLFRSMQQKEAKDDNLMTLHDTVLRLVEASWLLWKLHGIPPIKAVPQTTTPRVGKGKKGSKAKNKKKSSRV